MEITNLYNHNKNDGDLSILKSVYQRGDFFSTFSDKAPSFSDKKKNSRSYCISNRGVCVTIDVLLFSLIINMYSVFIDEVAVFGFITKIRIEIICYINNSYLG